MHDLIIVGAGPAGMTAAVYAVRKNMDTAVISVDVGGQANWSYNVENYLGYTHISGSELVKRFQDHIQSFGIKEEYSRVETLEKTAGGFAISTESNKRFESKAVLIASGSSPRKLDIPGEKDFIGKGVMFCATCDGPVFSGLDVAVVGGGNSGYDAAVQLMKIAKKLYIIEYSDRIIADEVYREQVEKADNVQVMTNTAVTEVLGDKLMSGIKIKDVKTGQERELAVDGMFLKIGYVPNVSFVSDLVDLNKNNEIIVDCACRTNVQGLFGAGDVTSVPEKQIIVAAGEGAKAALSAYRYISRGGK
ncbi:MAG TPA: FAD-dependent oxidoreductase [bacterium]|nr:FAD-dependent oxidoreductase [bacterium]